MMQENSPQLKLLRDQNIDFGIIAKGCISLYYNPDILNYDIDLLKNKNYSIIEFDGESIANENVLHFHLKDKLEFPDYYGKNFDALDDCLIDFKVGKNGVVLVFKHLNHLALETIYNLLDIFANHARRKFATGSKLLILVQVDNPKFNISEPIGALNFYLWNDKEHFEINRK